MSEHESEFQFIYDKVGDLFPIQDLTDRDRELAHLQCELQNATSREQIEGMVEALAYAKTIAFSHIELDAQSVVELVKILGSKIEPQQAHDWRKIQVTFASGDFGVSPQNIERIMNAWAGAYATNALAPEESYYQFEKIHPVLDGNGRIGHCLWAIAEKRINGIWPEDLPPDVFSGNYQKPINSAFGKVES